MTEERVAYKVAPSNLLQPEMNRATMSTEVDALRGQLRVIKRQLIGLLTEVDRILGDEPSVMTRAERRRG